jgi:TPR repeat protein
LDELAECYFYGKGVNVDYFKAIEYYKSQYALQNHYSCTDSEYKIGYCYYHGLGVKRDLNKAKEWLQIAGLERGNKEAIKLLEEIFSLS